MNKTGKPKSPASNNHMSRNKNDQNRRKVNLWKDGR